MHKGITKKLRFFKRYDIMANMFFSRFCIGNIIINCIEFDRLINAFLVDPNRFIDETLCFEKQLQITLKIKKLKNMKRKSCPFSDMTYRCLETTNASNDRL